MRSIHTETAIMAPAARVWEIFSDLARWPAWNPFMVAIAGQLVPGRALDVRIVPPGKSPMTFRPRVTRLDAGREVRWLGTLGLPGLFDGEHGFRITPEAEGRCRFEQFETFTGLLVPPLFWIAGDATRAGFEAMNRALKARAESPTL